MTRPTATRRAWSRPLRLVVVTAVLSAGSAAADEWLVYIGAGLEAIDGGWAEQGDQVVFRLRGGTLVSVPYADVDLPASTFITWQLGGRRRLPPRQAVPETPPPADTAQAPGCVAARLFGLRSGETLEVATGERREIVHLACLDAPETEHKYPELGWFGRATKTAIELQVRPGAAICITEQEPPRRDSEGHRIVFVTLADGRDYTAAVIAGGLGLLRPGACAAAASYRQLEDLAIAAQRGLWGGMASRPAFAAANLAVSVAGGPPPPRRSGGGRG